MAATRRAAGETNSSPSTFSYAQAAKGISSGPPSKAASGSVTPAKDASNVNGNATAGAAATNVAEEAAATLTKDNTPASAPEIGTETQTNGHVSAQPKQTANASTTALEISSPDFGTPSTSTLGKDDDVASLPNAASSESTWENKSQASTSLEKPTDSTVDGKDTKEKGAVKERKEPVKSLQPAPPPAVNIWAKRAEEARKLAPVPQRPSSSVATPPVPRFGNADAEKQVDGSRFDGRRKSKVFGASQSNDASQAKKDRRPQQPHAAVRSEDDDKVATGRRDVKPSGVSTTSQTESQASAPPPPPRDQQAWPTVENAQGDERKKAFDKGEKDDKDRQPQSSTKPHGKSDWKTLEISPNIIFETPMGNTGSRRGGRGGARGGATYGSRGGSVVASTGETNEKNTATGNGEESLSHRAADSAARFRNEPQTSRGANTGSGPPQSQQTYAHGDRKAQPQDSVPSKKVHGDESNNDASSYGHLNNGAPRPPNPNKAKQGRKFEDKRKDGESAMSHEANGSYYQRRVSSATQPDFDAQERKAQFLQEGTPAHKGSGRGGSYAAHTTRERGEGRQRGGGRGRGGNGYSGHSQYGQSFMQYGYAQQGYYTSPQSPSANHPDAMNAYFPTGNINPRFRNGPPRAQSIPVSHSPYNRGGPQYMQSQAQPLSINTYGQGYENIPMYPVSAGPYPPYTQFENQQGVLTQQLEYYFSDENLLKDIFLRKNMDSKGFVLLELIANFPRVKALSADLELVKHVCFHSQFIEYRIGSDGKERIRKREGWDQFVLAKEDRVPAAQNDGSDEMKHPPLPYGHMADPYGRYPQTAPPSSYSQRDLTFQTMGDSTHVPSINGHGGAGPPIVNGERQQSSQVQSAEPLPKATETTSASKKGLNVEADSFSDEQIPSLSVISRSQTASNQSNASAGIDMTARTFSNGTVDDSVQADSVQSNGVSHDTHLNGTLSPQGRAQGTGFEVPDNMSSEVQNPNDSLSAMHVYWMKGKEAPLESVPPGSTCEKYVDLHRKAFEQRQSASDGVCPHDMDVLYQFWSHFLIRNFNTSMYREFCHTAYQDCHLYSIDRGMQNLIKYYVEALTSHSNMRHGVARDFIDLVKAIKNKHARSAFLQLQRALKNEAINPQNRQIIETYIDEDLAKYLDG